VVGFVGLFGGLPIQHLKTREKPTDSRFGACAPWKRPPAKPIATVQKYTRRAAFRRRRAMDFARVSRIGGVGVANAPQNAWFGAGVATVSRIGGVGVANAPQNAWFGAGVATVSRIGWVGVANAPQNAWFGAGFVEIIVCFFFDPPLWLFENHTKMWKYHKNVEILQKIHRLCVIACRTRGVNGPLPRCRRDPPDYRHQQTAH